MVCEGEQKQSKSARETNLISENEVPSNQTGNKIYMILLIVIKPSLRK